MERGQLQRAWALGRFDGRTTAQTTQRATVQLQNEFGDDLAALQAAGRPSRAGANRFSDEAPTRRTSNGPSAARRDTIAAEDGFLAPAAGARVRDDRAARRSLYNGNATSDLARQTCPEGLGAAQWQSSAQQMMTQQTVPESRPAAVGRRRLEPPSAAAAEAARRREAPQPSGRRGANVARGDFVSGLDTLSLAKSLRRAGQMPPALGTASTTTSRQEQHDPLILENYQRSVPGCTLHQPRLR